MAGVRIEIKTERAGLSEEERTALAKDIAQMIVGFLDTKVPPEERQRSVAPLPARESR